MNKDIVYKKLLCYGLFPNRLSDVLSSDQFGRWIIDNENKLNIGKKEKFSLIAYRLTRNNNAPRQLGIPHPLGFVRLCRELRESWNAIERNFDKESYKKKSMVCPKSNNKNKRLISMTSYDKNEEQEQLELDNQFGKKYLVCADVASCYPSIYTHSISWALIGKGTAKKNIGKNTWYNKIDKACQNLQDGETRGLCIGPDTSGVLSEIIFSKIDEKLKKYDYIRFIDDYKCSCKTREEAEEFIRDLSKFLEEYRLCLNTKKTKIIQYPKAINDDWVRKLRQAIEWEKIGIEDKDDVIGFLDLASELFEKHPNESSIRYAAQVLKKKEYNDYKTFKLVLRYLLNLCFLYPYVIDALDGLINVGLRSFTSKRQEIKQILENAVQSILKEHTKYRRSDAITWALFLAIKYELEINKLDNLTNDILKTKDCLPVLMCYLYRKKYDKNVSAFVALTAKVDASEWWLFIYELNRLESIAHSNPEMEKVRKAKISFLSDTINEKL